MPERNDDWRAHLIDDDDGICRILAATRRIAVLGIKIDPAKPGYFVPEYAQRVGFEIVPVPVYYPEVTDILAKKPKVVWMQLGISNDAAAEQLARAGIDVVQDRCLMVELRQRSWKVTRA